MKVLVTGGTGFIGARLALQCLASGDEVNVLGQANNAAEQTNRTLVEQRGGTVILGSVTDETAVRAAVAGAEIVYHLAAAQHEANVPDQRFWDVNLEGTRTLLQASVMAGVKRFVHGSTIGVYGSAMAGKIDDNTPLHPDNIYGVTKKEGETLVMSYAEKLPVVVVRISETYGAGDRRLLKLFKAIDKGVFFMVGRGENKHQLIYVDDLVRGLRLAATRESVVGQILVLAGKEAMTTNQMVKTIAAALGVREPRLRAPLWPFLTAAVVLETLLRPLGIQPPLHRRRMDFFTKSFFFSCDKAQELLAFEPRVNFHDGAAETAKWYREHGYL